MKNPRCFVIGEAKAPTKSTSGSAGWDVYANKQITILGNSVKPIPVGIKVACENDEYFRVADRSGNATKSHMHVVAGVIDSDYRGEVKVAIHNTGKNHIIISNGMKIAQLILTKINPSEFEFVGAEKDLGQTNRGERGGINN